MHLFYCDETNLERRENDFFVYGGLIIPGVSAAQLHGLLSLIAIGSNI
jgi:hypothetical protein